MAEFAKGSKVKFRPGARSTTKVTAEVIGRTETGKTGYFLITKDSTGVERKIRPGSCSAA